MQSLWLPFIPCYIHGIFDSVSNFLFPHCRLFAMRYFEPPIDWLLVINCNSYLLLCLCMSAVAWISVQYGVALDRDERTQSMWSLNPACVSESCAHHLLSIKKHVNFDYFLFFPMCFYACIEKRYITDRTVVFWKSK